MTQMLASLRLPSYVVAMSPSCLTLIVTENDVEKEWVGGRTPEDRKEDMNHHAAHVGGNGLVDASAMPRVEVARHHMELTGDIQTFLVQVGNTEVGRVLAVR